MSRTSRLRLLGPVLAAVAAAEAGRRLLSPPAPPVEPMRVDLQMYFSAEEIARGRRYARPQLALGLAGSVIDLAALALLARRPPVLLRRHGDRPLAGGAAAAAGLSLALSLPSLPLRALARRRSIAVGLDTQTWRAWAGDVAKASVIQTVLAGGGGALVTAATRRWPRGWWAPAAGGSVVFGAALAALAPVVLEPIFNKFQPLPAGETRSDVLELAGAAGVKVGEVYSVDASRRTTAANAYVSGLGPTKRVVLYDTLLDRYSRDEIRLVVAHELGHVRHRDVPRSVVYAAIVAPAAALAVQRVSWELSEERGTPAALAALALAAALVSTPIGAVANGLSRAVERRADHFSLELAGAPEAFVSFERTIALQNVADLDPPWWVSRLLATHPPTAERIGAAVAFAQAHAAAA
ncbi:MAG TPA: M48 family metalloprotease [Solirubrobacteraceae bacterium]|nr:M48 family metalloprotease [Solirubrobacteraceae bacterium]